MKKLLTQIEKEISIASKAFNSASQMLNKFRELSFKEATEKQFYDFNKANEDYQKYNKILTALYPMRDKINDLLS